MVIAIEPMINIGTPDVRELDDGWTVVTADGKLRTLRAHRCDHGGRSDMPDRSLTDIFRDCAGTVVYSVAGRDKKRPFVIVGVADEDSGTVYIADGLFHTLPLRRGKS